MKKLCYFSLLIFVLNSCSNNSVDNNSGDKFLGTWHNPQMHGKSFEKLVIEKNGDDFLVTFTRKVFEDAMFYNHDGEFKEVGKLVGNSIVINDRTKISLINNGDGLLMRGIEFAKGDKEAVSEQQVDLAPEQIQKNNKIPGLDAMLGTFQAKEDMPKIEVKGRTIDYFTIQRSQENILDITFCLLPCNDPKEELHVKGEYDPATKTIIHQELRIYFVGPQMILNVDGSEYHFKKY